MTKYVATANNSPRAEGSCETWIMPLIEERCGPGSSAIKLLVSSSGRGALAG